MNIKWSPCWKKSLSTKSAH